MNCAPCRPLAWRSLRTAEGQEVEEEPNRHFHTDTGGWEIQDRGWRKGAVFSEGTALFWGVIPAKEMTAPLGRLLEEEVKWIRCY